MTDIAWIDTALTSARPQVVGALYRYFNDIDVAEEAFQEACLRALGNWPKNGPPRNVAAWLIMVGRNSGIDGKRKTRNLTALPDEDILSSGDDEEARIADAVDGADYRDDILQLLFICCHPALPATQQIALALRIVSGLSVKQIARAFLVSEAAMEQRITRAKRVIAESRVVYETPGAIERAERVGVVLAMIYLIFNEGYSAMGAEADARRPLCDEAIRLSRLLLRMFPTEPEMMGLLALMLLQHSRASARLDAEDTIILLEDQNRGLWDAEMIAEGLALVDKAVRHERPGVYQLQAAIAAIHSRANVFSETRWPMIVKLYEAFEALQPSPVVTLNRAAAVSKVEGPQAALAIVEPLGKDLNGYFYFHGLRGHLLKRLDRRDDARQAFDRAIALANSTAEANFIRKELDSLSLTAEL
jgi:RNA polymerase sigma-70 factor, ECF subfamily